MTVKREYPISTIISTLVIMVGMGVSFGTLQSGVSQNAADNAENKSALSDMDVKLATRVEGVVNSVNEKLNSHDKRFQELDKYVSAAEVQFDNMTGSQKRMETKLDKLWDYLVLRDRENTNTR